MTAIPRLPLVIDLDGTLIYSDLLWENIVLFLKQRFFEAWRLPLWLLRGKVGFKAKLASEVVFDPAALPYDKELLRMIAGQRALGRVVVLATGSPRQHADLVAGHLQLFDRVFATEGKLNLTAANKAGELVNTYGDQGFDYIGNARADIPVWHRSSTAYSVTRRPFKLGKGRATASAGSARGGGPMPLLKAMRPRQWLKNLLVFVPMLSGHMLTAAAALESLVAFAAFCMCASSAYLLNDALDAQDDRLHPTKKSRPIAAGTLALPLAMAASALLAGTALLLCALYDPLLLLAVALYFVATLAYSFVLKRLLMVDIVTLAILYSMRILGGSASTHITPSFWLLAFSFFIFLSLALLKRHSELVNLQLAGKRTTNGRGYTTADQMPIAMMGVNSAFLSVLIFMLYFYSASVAVLYKHPDFLLGIVPLLVFWLGPLWVLSFRGQVNEDPVLYVSKDRLSLGIVACCIVLAAAASW
jgi:4-hydroxybenzoate polyprenyltransferase